MGSLRAKKIRKTCRQTFLKVTILIFQLNTGEKKTNTMSQFGPQVDIPVGAPETPGSNIGAWQGLTIKEILEKVDLSNIIMEEDNKQKIAKNNPMISSINPESAFLGPKLWSRPMPMSGGGVKMNEDFSVMNIDDLLSENGFDFEEQESSDSQSEAGALSPRSTSDMDTEMVQEQPEVPYKKMKRVESSSSRPTKAKIEGENTFLYVESKRAKMEREKEEKRKRAAMEIEFSPQELALATVPGLSFDPRERKFAPDELRPQPIIRKRKKSFVPEAGKDGKYWEKREKNNVAARRGREARRLKENQIALRTAYLEKENNGLRVELDTAKAENLELLAERQLLLEKLKQYE